ncbi:hypothetical protein SISNIDRAFT_456644, partial [Sistotremastrum niveocremeum HHB9708]
MMASAYITSVASQTGHWAKVGYNYGLTWQTAPYIQNWDDYSIVLGWEFPGIPHQDPEFIGSIVSGSIDLPSIGESRTGGGSFSMQIFIDPTVFVISQPTAFTFTAAITSAIG